MVENRSLPIFEFGGYGSFFWQREDLDPAFLGYIPLFSVFGTFFL